MTYPIVLAHGVCRFDILWRGTLDVDNNDDPRLDNLHYFKGIRTMLKSEGYQVYHSKVSWGAKVDKRAEDLRNNILNIIQDSQKEKVNIVAHSMGGLDARHMLFNDRNTGRIHKKVASLTTISTPHEGSPFADWGLRNLSSVPALFNRLGLDINGFEDLTTEACKAFNRRADVEDFERKCENTIAFQTYAGKQNFWGVFNLLKVPFRLIEKKEGENDGLVSVDSARWRDRYFRKTLDRTDHFNELGWWEPGQLFSGEKPDQLLQRIHSFYADIARGLP